MSGLQFNNDSDFKRENITTTRNKDNIVILEGNSRNTNDIRTETRRPQFSNEQFDNAKRVKIKPNLNAFDFQSMANPKRNNDKSDDEVESNDEDIDLSDANSDEEMENINMPNFADTNMEQNLDDESMEGDEVSSEDGISVEDDDVAKQKYFQKLSLSTQQSESLACIAVGKQQVGDKSLRIEMCVLRLTDVTTDLLITLSIPDTKHGLVLGEDGLSNVFRDLLYSFCITDWTLFC